MPGKKKNKAAIGAATAVPLAIALIHGALIPGSAEPSPDLTAAPVQCDSDVEDFHSCHGKYPAGCALTKPTKNTYDVYLNLLKNQANFTGAEKPAKYFSALDDFESLEAKLPSDLTSSNHANHKDELAKVGEGKTEGVIGYLYGAKAEGQESSNCKLDDDAQHENVDYHIYIGFDSSVAQILRKQRNKESLTANEKKEISAHALHSTSMIVEMTPHTREALGSNWTIDALNQSIGSQVRVVGQLIVDNEHDKVGQNCYLDQKNNLCWRASVWELHPVTQFKVCSLDDGCKKETDWRELDGS